MKRRRVSLVTVVAAAMAAGCAHSSFNLATEQQDHSITSTQKEVELGRKIAQRVEEELPLLADASAQRRVKEIGERIAAVCDRQELVYSFAVLDEESVNAFSLPGGYIYVHRGLIEKVKNDDELAGVIAHEVAHVTARHSVKRYESSLGLQLAQLATIVARQGQAARGVSVAMQAARLAYARQDELEADRLAVKYLKAAGYDASAMLRFLETLQAIHTERSVYMPRGVIRPQYALTHPFVPERVRAVKEALYGVADYIDYLNTQD